MARSPGSRGLIPLGHLPGGQATLNSSIAGITDIRKEEQRRDRGHNLGYPGYFQDLRVAGVLWDAGKGSDMKRWGEEVAWQSGYCIIFCHSLVAAKEGLEGLEAKLKAPQKTH